MTADAAAKAATHSEEREFYASCGRALLGSAGAVACGLMLSMSKGNYMDTTQRPDVTPRAREPRSGLATSLSSDAGLAVGSAALAAATQLDSFAGEVPASGSLTEAAASPAGPEFSGPATEVAAQAPLNADEIAAHFEFELLAAYIAQVNPKLDAAEVTAVAEELARAAQAQQLDVWLLASIARYESTFRRGAIGRAGEHGLLQIHPCHGKCEGLAYTDYGALMIRRKLDAGATLAGALKPWSVRSRALAEYDALLARLPRIRAEALSRLEAAAQAETAAKAEPPLPGEHEVAAAEAAAHGGELEAMGEEVDAAAEAAAQALPDDDVFMHTDPALDDAPEVDGPFAEEGPQ